MADRWARELHGASYDGLQLDVLRAFDSEGNDIVRHVYPNIGGADVEPKGKRIRITRAELIFFAADDDDDYLARFMSFHDAAHRQEASTFVHPITGSYVANVSDFEWSVEPRRRNAILVTCTFEESTADIANVEDPGPGSEGASGVESVNVAAAALDSELADSGITSTVTADVTDRVSAWPDVDPRQVRLELAYLSRRIDVEVQELQAMADLSQYNVLLGFMELHGAISDAAMSFIQSSEHVVERLVDTPISLFALASQIYGASEGLSRLDDLRRLNDIDNEARIEPGTTIRAIAPVTRV